MTETASMKTRIGLYNPAFQMVATETEFVFDEPNVTHKGWWATFHLKMGRMVFNGRTHETTFVLEIHYQGSYDHHSARLGAMTFGSHLYANFAEVAHRLAAEFCESQGLTLSKHLNSWPQFQAIVFRPTVADAIIADIADAKAERT